jgi:UMF1 family MFS transporter
VKDAGPGVPPPTRLERAAWCLFDFANSSFTTIIVTVVYPRVFASLASTPQRGEIGWAWALAASQAVVVLLGPVVGALADRRGAKKRYLATSWIVCVAGCAALSLIVDGPISAAWLLFVAANVGFSFGENLIAAFLPELAPPEKMGRLSGIGWAVGYFGGLASLAVAMVLVDGGAARWVPVATAVFFLAGGLPTFLFLRERARPRAGGASALADAFRDVRTTLGERSSHPDLFRLLLTLFLEQAGVAIVIGFAAIYAAAEFALSVTETIELFIGLQLAAAAGAALFGVLQDRIGGKRALAGTILAWLLAVGLTLLTRSLPVFCVGAAVAGIAMGSSQASGRAMVGTFTPRDRQGEWFGLWGLAMKSANVVGPLAIALLREWTSMRVAMGSTAVFFLLSLAALAGLDERRGMARAGNALAERPA